MASKYRERPICRKCINKILQEGYTLKELAYWSEEQTMEQMRKRGMTLICLSEGMTLQARRMLKEGNVDGNYT